MGWMSDYIESQDRDYDRMNPEHESVMQGYLAAKDREEEVDDRSLMQVYLDSKDAEDD